MYRLYLKQNGEQLLLPVTPAEIETRTGNRNKTAYILDFGEMNLAKKPGLTEIRFTALLPGRAYTLPSSVSCPDGKRDATFFLTVDIAYLKANADKDFSLPVTISDPTRYALNDKLTTTQVRIDTSELLSKEGL